MYSIVETTGNPFSFIENIISFFSKKLGSIFCLSVKPTFGQSIMDDYAVCCFRYIHQNPFEANLVDSLEEWEFSSFRDYLGLRKGTLCNQSLANKLLEFELNEFFEFSKKPVPSNFKI